ncbi:MAG: pyruvate kinase [Chromatiales bacterium 21-64-14]|nr:MAG: pyruvate kinase [Chromatiales bacterium 21-64-14]HQU16993.1 pyruvate kinase [Gammaproteobacteria bacterium]
MLRRTKIVATLGPATDEPGVLDAVIQAGVDVVRLNFSHGSPDEHVRRAEEARSRARAHGRHLGVIADLQGPKIRIERFKDDAVVLQEGEKFILDTSLGADEGTRNAVGLTYKALPGDVKRGDTLLLDDGQLVLWVEDVAHAQIICRVVVGGKLSNNKGINRQGGGLSAAALTEKDRADIKIAAAMKADYLAVSFPRKAEDVEEARRLLRAAGGHGAIIAKIERAEAVESLEAILQATDVVMIARGDLGVEIGDAELTAVQKLIIRKARAMSRVVITATQMMQSMVDSQIPTRAEVFDVANAVLDGTDAVMLSAETATGKYPAKAVAAMDRICRGAERYRIAMAPVADPRAEDQFSRTDEAIAMAAMYTANHLGVRAIAALTESGSTSLWMSRVSSGIPIYALTRHVETRRKVTLYRGVYPISFDVTTKDHALVNREVIDELVRRGAVHDHDLVIITKGDLTGVSGGTNAMKIVRVGEMLAPDD